MQFGTILHPTDFSEHSQSAWRVACSLAHDHGSRLVIAHVAPSLIASIGGVIPPAASYDAEVRRAERQLERLQPTVSGVAVERLFLRGTVVECLLRAVEQTHAELIVMGTHGRTGLMRLLMGSVAESMVRKAPCMVLTVKAAAPAPAIVASHENGEYEDEPVDTGGSG